MKRTLSILFLVAAGVILLPAQSTFASQSAEQSTANPQPQATSPASSHDHHHRRHSSSANKRHHHHHKPTTKR